MKKDIYTLGIESSCDETSVAIVKNGREVLSNVIDTQIKDLEREIQSDLGRIATLEREVEAYV